MAFFLGAIGIVFCIGLAASGYLGPMIIGAIVGSFFGIAGFGGAIAGTIPGAIIGAIFAIAMAKKTHP